MKRANQSHDARRTVHCRGTEEEFRRRFSRPGRLSGRAVDPNPSLPLSSFLSCICISCPPGSPFTSIHPIPHIFVQRSSALQLNRNSHYTLEGFTRGRDNWLSTEERTVLFLCQRKSPDVAVRLSFTERKTREGRRVSCKYRRRRRGERQFQL